MPPLQVGFDQCRHAEGERVHPLLHSIHRKNQRQADCPLPANIAAEQLDTVVWKRLASKQQKLAAARDATSVEARVAALTKSKRKAFQDLPADRKGRIARILLKGIVLNPDSIILDRRIGEPIVGVVRKREGALSHPYRFMDVEWLN